MSPYLSHLRKKGRCWEEMDDRKNILREYTLHPSNNVISFDPMWSPVELSPAVRGFFGLQKPLSYSSRTYNRPGFSSKCPSILFLPVHYGAFGRTPRPSSQWTALLQWHQWASLCQWDTCEQGLPRGCCGLPRREISAALPRRASAGNVLLGKLEGQVWDKEGAVELPLGASPFSSHPSLLGKL
jgi:hypothetical protein